MRIKKEELWGSKDLQIDKEIISWIGVERSEKGKVWLLKNLKGFQDSLTIQLEGDFKDPFSDKLKIRIENDNKSLSNSNFSVVWSKDDLGNVINGTFFYQN